MHPHYHKSTFVHKCDAYCQACGKVHRNFHFRFHHATAEHVLAKWYKNMPTAGYCDACGGNKRLRQEEIKRDGLLFYCFSKLCKYTG